MKNILYRPNTVWALALLALGIFLVVGNTANAAYYYNGMTFYSPLYGAQHYGGYQDAYQQQTYNPYANVYNPYTQQNYGTYQPAQNYYQYGYQNQYSGYQYQYQNQYQNTYQTQPTASGTGVNLSAQSATVTRGDSVILSWSAINADVCIASAGWIGGLPISGTKPVTPNETTIYTITCSNATGGSASDSVTVTVTEPLPISADIKANGSDGPVTLPFGSRASLNWISANATNCRVLPSNFTGTIGSSQTDILNFTQTFTVTCANGRGGIAQDSVTITILPLQPYVDLTVSPFQNNQVNYGSTYGTNYGYNYSNSPYYGNYYGYGY